MESTEKFLFVKKFGYPLEHKISDKITEEVITELSSQIVNAPIEKRIYEFIVIIDSTFNCVVIDYFGVEKSTEDFILLELLSSAIGLPEMLDIRDVVNFFAPELKQYWGDFNLRTLLGR